MSCSYFRRFLLLSLAPILPVFCGCGGFKKLKITDLSDQRVCDLSLTKKVLGRREFIFFATTKTGTFLEGSIQGVITDYTGNPIEGVTVKVMQDSGKKDAADGGGDSLSGVEENAGAAVNLSFAPGISDTMGLYKIRFSLPINNSEVDVKGKLVYNPGWDQQKLNLGKAYEPQMKDTPFRLYYNIKSGILAFAEGVRKVIVQPVGEGKGRMKILPGSVAPGQEKHTETQSEKPAQKQEADKAEEDMFKGFDFGQ